MESIVGVCDTHDHAVEALQKLKDGNFPMKNVSIMGIVDKVENHLHVSSHNVAENTPAIVGAATGTVVGLLTGIGVFAIPGLGFLYGAGAIIGTIAGFDLGVIGGGIATLLTTAGLESDEAEHYNAHVKNGKFLLVVHGTASEVVEARQLVSGLDGVTF